MWDERGNYYVYFEIPSPEWGSPPRFSEGQYFGYLSLAVQYCKALIEGGFKKVSIEQNNKPVPLDELGLSWYTSKNIST